MEFQTSEAPIVSEDLDKQARHLTNWASYLGLDHFGIEAGKE